MPSSVSLLVVVILFAAPRASVAQPNLLVNGDAETTPTQLDPVPGWSLPSPPQRCADLVTFCTPATAAIDCAGQVPPTCTTVSFGATAEYGLDGYPAPTDPGPTERGTRLFTGGTTAATSLVQAVSLPTVGVAYTLCGFIGGFDTQGDDARVTVRFFDDGGFTGEESTIGPVSADDRFGRSGLCLRSASGFVPVLTTFAEVTMAMRATEGSFNDGYVDNLALVLGETCPESAGIPCAPTTTTTLPPPLAAVFTAVPLPTCTGTPMVFDASASTTPNGPITSYRFEYTQPVRRSLIEFVPFTVVIADGPSAVVDHDFTWNYTVFDTCYIAGPLPRPRLPKGVRDDVDVVLTITDATGAQASASVPITFAQRDSCASRSACPFEGTFEADLGHVRPMLDDGVEFLRADPPKKNGPADVVTLVDCQNAAGCLGYLSVATAPKLRTGAIQAAATAAITIAEGEFASTGPGVVEVKAPLTPAGRRLLKRKRKLRAVATIGDVAPSGAIVESTRTLKLRVRRSKAR